MTKYLFLAVSFLLVVFCFSFKPAEHLEWKSWDDAYKNASKNNKIIVVDIYTDWCGWCKRMDKDTYENAEVVSILKQKYEVVKLNPEKQNMQFSYQGKTYSSAELLQTLVKIGKGEVRGYPTTLFVVPLKGAGVAASDNVHVVGGYLNAHDFKDALSQLDKQYGGH